MTGTEFCLHAAAGLDGCLGRWQKAVLLLLPTLHAALVVLGHLQPWRPSYLRRHRHPHHPHPTKKQLHHLQISVPLWAAWLEAWVSWSLWPFLEMLATAADQHPNCIRAAVALAAVVVVILAFLALRPVKGWLRRKPPAEGLAGGGSSKVSSKSGVPGATWSEDSTTALAAFSGSLK